mmetsp:Transcript_65914/g.190152  ORF Transcript_65914/g.190152 Transcript_65914/m.190152 type:complete len:534 (+) Transcript_65914:85-1686(+)
MRFYIHSHSELLLATAVLCVGAFEYEVGLEWAAAWDDESLLQAMQLPPMSDDLATTSCRQLPGSGGCATPDADMDSLLQAGLPGSRLAAATGTQPPSALASADDSPRSPRPKQPQGQEEPSRARKTGRRPKQQDPPAQAPTMLSGDGVDPAKQPQGQEQTRVRKTGRRPKQKHPPVKAAAPTQQEGEGIDRAQAPTQPRLDPLPRVQQVPVNDPEMPAVETQIVLGFRSLLHDISFLGVLQVVCVGLNTVMYALPIPQAFRWHQQGNSGDDDAGPCMAIAFAACQWSFYGFFAWIATGRSSYLVLLKANVFGCVFGFCYTVVFFRTCYDSAMLNRAKKLMIMCAGLTLCELAAASSSVLAYFAVGCISVACSILNAFSLVLAWPAVVSGAVPGYVVLVTMCASFVWVVFGAALEDRAIAAPHLASVAACVFCLWMKMRGQTKDSRSEPMLEPQPFFPMAPAKLRPQRSAEGPPTAPWAYRACAGTGEAPSQIGEHEACQHSPGQSWAKAMTGTGKYQRGAPWRQGGTGVSLDS